MGTTARRSAIATRLIVSLGAAVLGFAAGDVRADPPEVVVSIKPIHSIVAAVVEGIATPTLIVKGGASPHGYALRPSDAEALSRADLVFWVGADLERFLVKPLAALASNARVVTLMRLDGLIRLTLRESGAWRDEPEDAPDDGDHIGFDPHIWLDPVNARVIARAAAVVLGEADPGNLARYSQNAETFAARLDALDAELRTALAPIAPLSYLVFHDAYRHFERRYGLNAVGSITVNPQHRPGAKRLIEMRTKIRALGARCLFSEPQFAPALAETIVEGTGARTGTLDPLGADLASEPDTYFAIMRGLAASLHECLTAEN